MNAFRNTFPTAHFLFIKCVGCYSDKDFLAKLGVPAIEHVSTWPGNSWLGIDGIICDSVKSLEHAVCISDDGQWLQLMDSLYFDLFYNRKFGRRLKKMASDYEIYHCYAGDTDDFVELKHWKGGRKARHLTGDVRLLTFAKNDGTPFQCESQYTADKAHKLGWQGRSFILAVAEEIGINVDQTQRGIRAYEIKPSKYSD